MPFNHGEDILLGLDAGRLEVLSGPQNKSISLISKVQIPNFNEDIWGLMHTNRCTDESLDLAVSTEKGLFFVTLAFKQMGRKVIYTAALNQEQDK